MAAEVKGRASAKCSGGKWSRPLLSKTLNVLPASELTVSHDLGAVQAHQLVHQRQTNAGSWVREREPWTR